MLLTNIIKIGRKRMGDKQSKSLTEIGLKYIYKYFSFLAEYTRQLIILDYLVEYFEIYHD